MKKVKPIPKDERVDTKALWVPQSMWTRMELGLLNVKANQFKVRQRKDGWVGIVHNKKVVADCNPLFFLANFQKVKG